jgi:hypothetical protein
MYLSGALYRLAEKTGKALMYGALGLATLDIIYLMFTVFIEQP